jgi:general secretion pathway protein K
MRPALQRSRGIALIVVLWILALLSITVGLYSVLARTETLQSRFLFDVTQARYAAEAGLHRAVFEMRNPDFQTRWVPDGRPYMMEFGGAVIEMRITDESGRIDINSAPADLLSEFLISRGLEEQRAWEIADAIEDWRDPDDLPRLYGAEIDEYDAAGYPYGPANQEFQSVDELQQVLGINFELFRQLEGLMTVHGRGGQINPAFAPAEVLAGMPDIDLQGAQQFVEERQQTHPADMTALMLPNGQMVNLQGGGGVFSIRSRATLENGAWTQIEATVSVGTDTRGRPFRILRWRENIEDQ